MRVSFFKYSGQAKVVKQIAKAIGLAAAGTLLSLNTSLSAFATTITADTAILKRSVTVESRLVTLGDLFSNAGSFANKAVFRSPSLGQSGTIQAERVVQAALEAGLRNIATNDVQTVKVARLSEIVTEADIADKLRAQLAAKGYVDATAKIDIELNTHLSDQHAAPGGFSPFSLSSLRYDRTTGRFSANLTIYGREDLGTIHLGGNAMETVMVPVISRSISRGEIVSQSDIAMTPLPLQKALVANAATLEEVVGKAARQTLRAGMIAQRRLFYRARHGQAVRHGHDCLQCRQSQPIHHGQSPVGWCKGRHHSGTERANQPDRSRRNRWSRPVGDQPASPEFDPDRRSPWS